MLRRSPLALKLPPEGEKGMQRCRHRAALSGGFGVASISYSRYETYHESMEPFLREVPDLHIGSWDVVGLGPRELPFSSTHTFLRALRPRVLALERVSAVAGLPGRDAMDKARG